MFACMNKDEVIFDASKEQKEAIRKEIAPMLNGSDFQKKKLHAGLKLKAEFFTNNAYHAETKLVYNHPDDYLKHRFVYVPFMIPPEQRHQYNGFAYMFELYIEDTRLIRRRVENLLKQKFVWQVYEYKASDNEPAIVENTIHG